MKAYVCKLFRFVDLFGDFFEVFWPWYAVNENTENYPPNEMYKAAYFLFNKDYYKDPHAGLLDRLSDVSPVIFYQITIEVSVKHIAISTATTCNLDDVTIYLFKFLFCC